ncbi:MAG: nuclear transport factor 2 family protein [Nocardioides sp.]
MDSLTQELIQVERRGWDALCTDDAVTYYASHLADDAVMAFPFGIMQREEALSAMATAQPWSHYEMEDPTVIALGRDSGVVVYRVTAEREGQEPFSAVLSSTFVRHGTDWKLAFHQQSFT